MDNKVAKGPLRILFYTLILALFFFLGHASALVVYRDGNLLSGNASNPLESFLSDGSLTNDDMVGFWEVYGHLNDNYIDKDLGGEGGDRVLVEGATKGLIRSLGDKYTNYFTKEEWAEIQEGNSGKFEGIGIKLLAGDQYAVIETPIKGAPAANAGIMAGDVITAVDGESVQGFSLGKVAEKIRGEKGTNVKIEVYRPSKEDNFEFDVERASIDVDSIDVEALDDGGYIIGISKFTESSYSEFQRQWLAAVKEADDNDAKYVVLDLRNNTGGWVDAAKFVLGEFLPEGSKILTEVDRDGNETVTVTDRVGRFQDVQLVLLVNGGSASSSEIVAGALQDLDRAKLVGTSTLGKGVEQRVISLSDGGSLHVVFKRWFTPNGKNLSDEKALTPDQEVELTGEDIEARRDPQLETAREMVK